MTQQAPDRLDLVSEFMDRDCAVFKPMFSFILSESSFRNSERFDACKV